MQTPGATTSAIAALGAAAVAAGATLVWLGRSWAFHAIVEALEDAWDDIYDFDNDEFDPTMLPEVHTA